MKLYYAPGTCALAIHIALIWAKENYELEKVKPGSDEYKKINPLAAVRAAGNRELHELLRMLDAHLQGRTWLVGEHKAVLDAYCYVMVRWLKYTDLKREAYPHIDKHFAMMAQDAGVIRAETEQGLR